MSDHTLWPYPRHGHHRRVCTSRFEEKESLARNAGVQRPRLWSVNGSQRP
jgi:hypothetical protein